MKIGHLHCAKLGERIGDALYHAAFKDKGGGLVREIPDHISNHQREGADAAVVRVNGGDEFKSADSVPNNKQRGMEISLPVPGPDDLAAVMLIGGLIHPLERVERAGNRRALLGQGQNVVVVKFLGREIKAHLKPFAESPLDILPLGMAKAGLHGRGVKDILNTERIAGHLLEALPVQGLPIRIVGAERLRNGNQGQLLQLGQHRADGLFFIGKALFKFLVFRVSEPDAGKLGKRRPKDPELFPISPKIEAPSPRDLSTLLVKTDTPILRPGYRVQTPGLLKRHTGLEDFRHTGPGIPLSLG